MIQRIQTIYLLVVTILGVLPCVFPIATAGDVELGFTTYPIYAALATIVPIVAFASIFFFKRRILQMRLCSFNVIIMLFQLIAMGVYLYLTPTAESENSLSISWPVIVPPINMILTYLAVRAIGKDEALVRSLNRLRK